MRLKRAIADLVNRFEIRATVFLLVVSCFVTPARCGDTITWTGNAGDKLWNTPSNWNPEQVPSSGDVVTIQSYASAVLVTQSTAPLESFSISGATLSMTNWTTQLSAETVSIGSGGIVTCAGPFNDTTDGVGGYANASRVWIACSNLTLAAGGSIDVSGKGFAAYNASSWNGKGYGPSAGSGRMCGAGHGGCALQTLKNNSVMGPYGSIEAPVMPGSAGGSSQSDIGGNGGGVVRIEASGTVTVNGSVLANGVGGVNYTARSAGAGGSIYIICNRFVGTAGSVKAIGGAGGYYSEVPLNAGGGRISIIYSAAEGATDVSGMVFDVQCGALSSNFNKNNLADCGTLYFSDSKLFLAQDGTGFGGQLFIPGFDSWTVAGDYSVARHLRFANEGFSLHVQGDLAVTGATARLDFGGCDVEPAFFVASSSIKWFQKYHSGDTSWSVMVDGDMRIENGAKFEAFPAVAAMTSEATGYGAAVEVSGQLKLGSGSFIVVHSDATNGASVAFATGSVDVEAGATFSADDYGFQWQYGPGHGWGSGQGGGYGGFGGGCYTNNGVVFGGIYGDSLRPWRPGSGGGYAWNDVDRRGGGGHIRIQSSGLVHVDGTITADALGNVSLQTWTTASAGSGGSILIECTSFTGSGLLSADGGSRTNSMRSVGYVAAGGGGRIAVWCGIPYDPETMSPANLAISETPPSTFSGSTSVDGGLYSTSASGVDTRYCGTDGTTEFVKVSYPVTVIVIR